MLKNHERRPIRLKRFDYSQTGEYFVTICTSGKTCILGKIIDGEMRLSKSGQIVESCWKAIPDHFAGVRVGIFQIMPNHLHGIVEIRDEPNRINHVGTRHAVSLQRFTGERFGQPRRRTLSTIIRSFKSAVTNQVHFRGQFKGESIWQGRFYDEIIRDRKGYFFVEQYISLNPLLWQFDPENPISRMMSREEFRKYLKERFGLGGLDAEWLYALYRDRRFGRKLNASEDSPKFQD